MLTVLAVVVIMIAVYFPQWAWWCFVSLWPCSWLGAICIGSVGS